MRTTFATATMLAIFTFCNDNVYAQANTALSNLASPTAINRDLIPGSTNTLNLGSTSRSWSNVYAGTSYFLANQRILYTPGTSNFFAGTNTGNVSLTGVENIATGKNILSLVTSGRSNTGIGYDALSANTTGNYNTVSGNSSLRNNSSGSSNTASGYSTLYANTTGNCNTASGTYALYSNTTAGYNTAYGSFCMMFNATGRRNTASGDHALFYNTNGAYNTASGADAGRSNTSGSFNTATGYRSLYAATTGNNNTAFGSSALQYNTTGYNNTAIGYNAGPSTGALVNTTAVGNEARPSASNQIMLGNSAVTSVRAAGGYVIYSDGRYKKELTENVPGLEFISLLRPVTYHYDIHGLDQRLGVLANKEAVQMEDAQARQAGVDEAARTAKERKLYTGFVAQEVEAAAKKLQYEFSGVYVPESESDVYGLSYSDFVVPLVKAMQQLSAKNDSLEARLERIESLLKMSATSNVSLSNASIAQNSPNPFRGNTVIGYTLPKDKQTSAQIVIYDMTGKKLKQLTVTGQGNGTVNIDAHTLAAGSYQYTFFVDGKMIDTKKMLLIK